MSNRTDIVVETDNAEGQVLLSASRVYDLTEDKTLDTINSEVRNTLNAVEDALAPLELTGTNTTGSTIPIGTFFYNNGTLVQATTNIVANASITGSNTVNAATNGALNSLLGVVYMHEIDVSGVSINTSDSGMYYKQVYTIPDKAATIIGAYWSVYWDSNVSILTSKRVVNLICTTARTLGSNRKVVVLYIKDSYIKNDT